MLLCINPRIKEIERRIFQRECVIDVELNTRITVLLQPFYHLLRCLCRDGIGSKTARMAVFNASASLCGEGRQAAQFLLLSCGLRCLNG
ncbi:hypothetical protein D3C73_1124730 [compost metagenome]